MSQPFGAKEKKFRLLFDEHPQPMWILDGATESILAANGAAAALLGFRRRELSGKPLKDLLGPDDARRFTEQVQARGGPASWRLAAKSGRQIDVEIAIHQIQYEQGTAELAVLMDTTGLKRLEEQLRQAQKMEAVGMLAGGVAHDFNNLLTIINGYSQLVLDSLAADDSNRHALEQILKAGGRAAALTRQLLAFSRRQVLQPRVLDLNQLVTSLAVMLQRLIGEDIDLRLGLIPSIGRVNADSGQLEQVLMNLSVNARDAMPHGGTLTIETADVDLEQSYASRYIDAKPGPYVMLAVSDTGGGMDEPTKARLFEPFFTTKPSGKGTGLGLSTVFGIIKQSGGTVNVYSEPGHGTSIKVYLPRVSEPAAAEQKAADRKTRRGGETILLVEDDDMVRMLVRETLAREGYRLLEAADPEKAARVAEAYKGTIHLLITDVVMPKSSGRELAAAIVKSRPGVQVLYMSGYTDQAIVNSGILESEAAFLQKPFTPKVLKEKVREVLEDGHGKEQRACS